MSDVNDTSPLGDKAGLSSPLGATSTPSTSPLADADPKSLETLFDRINAKLIQGLPEAITDEDLLPVVMHLRAERIKFIKLQDELGRAPPAARKAKPKSVQEAIATVVNAEDL